MQMSLQPVGCLPPELIQEIVAWTAAGQLENYCQIFKLSHVSILWRNVVVGFSALFTHADWNGWPTLVIELWCSWVVKPHLLMVHLGEFTISMMAMSSLGCPRELLLSQVSSQAGKLNILIDIEAPFMGGIAHNLVDLHMPSLNHLHFESVAPPSLHGLSLHIWSNKMQALRVLILKNINPIFLPHLHSMDGVLFHVCSLNGLWLIHDNYPSSIPVFYNVLYTARIL